MTRTNLLSRKEPALIATIITYLLVAAALFSSLKTKINPDGIAYLTIAKNYAQGHWQEAVNAYWSPLISWILAPLSWIPVELLFQFYVINVLLGAAGILAFFLLMRHLAFGPVLQIVLLPVVAVFMFRFAFYTSTPDLLSVVLLLFFLLRWLRVGMLQHPYQAAIWIVVLYFSKAYNFFFITGLFCFEAIVLLLNKKTNPLQIAGKGLKIYALFFIIVSPWIYALHHKYGILMLAGTSKFNHGAAIVNLSMLGRGIPGTENLRNSYDFFTAFTAPPHDYSVIPWEDPVRKANYTDYAAFSSFENFMLQIRVIYVNLRLLFWGWSGILSIVAIGLYSLLAGFFLEGKRAFKATARIPIILDLDISKIFVFSLLYLLGYLLFFIEDRYLWALIITGILGIGNLVNKVWKAGKIPGYLVKLNWPAFLVMMVVTGLAAYAFIWNHFFYDDAINANIGQAEYVFAKSISDRPVSQKRMVHYPGTEDNSLYVSWFTAYFSGGRHYNCLPADILKANQLVSENDISIVFVPDTTNVPGDFIIKNWKKISGPIPDTDVYIKP